MPVGYQNLEFLNHNASRRYPLADDADGNDTTGAFRIPDDFIVELDLPVHAGLAVSPAGFFVRSVSAYASGYGLVIGYQPADDADPVTVATALIPTAGFARNSVFALGGVGAYADTVGKVTIGKLDSIADQPPGFWEFSLATTRLDPDAVRPVVRGVSALVCVNGDQESAPLYGTIELQAGPNVQLLPVVEAGADPVIRISAISGAGTVQDCVCEGDAASTDPIKRINGVTPTTAGDLTLIGSDCVDIQVIENGIRLVDKCAAPCCGPVELERITRDLTRLGEQAAEVFNMAGQLKTSVDTMDLVVLGSKIGDRSCIECT